MGSVSSAAQCRALTNVEFNASFILKTALKQNPVAFMTVCLVTLFVSAGYSIRLIDR